MATSSKSPYEVTEFTSGITDDPFDKDPKAAIELDNFNIEPDGSILSRPGSVVEDTTNPQIPAGAARIGALIDYDNGTNLLVQSQDKVYFRNPSAYSTITGPTANDVFSVGTEANNTTFSQWNNHVYLSNDGFPSPMKIYKDSGGVFRVNNNGLPALASSPTCTPTAGANSYIYAFHHSFSYTVGDQTFQDEGPITTVEVNNADAPNSNQIAITAIPVIANGATDNYATSTITIEIYRTTNGGATYYKVGAVTNGTTTFNDTVSDATLATNATIYTNDGTVEFDPVPKHKFGHVINNIAYYGFLQDSSGVDFPFRIRQSTPLAPSSAPETFFTDLEDEIKGIGSVQSIPIVLCKRHIYRLEGNFDQFGRGGINPVRISDTAGCISHLSIVSAEGQLFWAGNDGFYTSDGYKVMKVSDKVNSRYKLFRDQADDVKRIYGTFDEENRRVMWAVQKNSSNVENDTVALLDLRWGLRDHSTFTTWSGTTFRASSLVFFNEDLYRADDNGIVYKHDPDTLTDPRVDPIVVAGSWEEETVIWTYESCSLNFGSSFFRKKPTRILTTARNIANTSIQIISIDDDGKRERYLRPIRWRNNVVWGDVNLVWGSTECKWKVLGVIEQWRRFPSQGLRVSFIRVKISNAYSVVSNSDTLGTAACDSTAKTATLTDAGTKDWPSDVVDYRISTDADAYAEEFTILERTSDDVITVVDSSGNFPNTTQKWLIKGYRKGEPLNLQGYVVHTANEDQQQITYETGDDGANV